MSALQSAAHDEVCADLEEDGWNVCELCGVRGDDDVMDQHLEGRKHQHREELCFSCETCGVKANSTKNMLTHLRGAKHQKVHTVPCVSCQPPDSGGVKVIDTRRFAARCQA